jgi:hypothetical protein
VIIYFLFQVKYSVVDIDPDTYKDKLKMGGNHFRLPAIEKYNPDKLDLAYAFQLTDATAKFKGVKLEKSENKVNKKALVSIYSNSTNFSYDIVYENYFPIGYIISARSPVLLKIICDKLILEDGFILKRSNYLLKNMKGYDILIKETEDSFIICELSVKYDDIENYQDLVSLRFTEYSKLKHFFGDGKIK